MADPVQWTIDQLWSALQKIESIIQSAQADLNADKAQLTALYSATRSDPDPKRAADNQALLQPLIHNNSVLRLSYLQPLKDKFNQGVNLASDALKSAGYTTPQLQGLGFAIVIAPVAAVTIVIVALAAADIVYNLTFAQRQNTATVAKIIGDPSTTPAQKKATLDALNKANKSLPPPGPGPGFDLGSLSWVLGGIALIMLLPSITAMLPKRKSA